MRRMKKLLVSLLAILLVFTMLPVYAVEGDTQPASTETLEADGWTAISTAAQFIDLITATPTGNFYLTNDIDFSTVDDRDGTKDGVYTAASLVAVFNGNLDGRGKTLKGFALKTSGVGGVFGSAATAAVTTISNLNIGVKGTPIIATIVNPGNVQFGFLVGAAGENSATYKLVANNVSVYGECTYPTAAGSNQARCGGIVGYCKEADFFNCSFEGKISVDCSAAKEIDIGGIVGDYEAYETRGRNTVIKNCYVDATLSAKHTGVKAVECVGGLVGHSENISFIDGCTVKGTYTATATGDKLGIAGIVGSIATAGVSNPLFVITDNVIEATVANEVYNYVSGGRLYVSGCSATQDTAAVDITESTTAADLSGKVGLIDSAADIKMIGNPLPLDGFYRLKKDVSLNDEVFDKSVIKGTFSGVFDGDGFAITDFVMKPTGGSTAVIGFFSSLSYADSTGDSVVTDIDFGTENKPVSFTGGAAQHAGVLAGYAGAGSNTKTSNRAVIDGVDVYVDMVYPQTSTQMMNGGIVGASYMASFLDCNVYGAISAHSNATFGHRTQIGGIVGITQDVKKSVYYNCNNFANMDINFKSAAQRVHIGGIIGNAAGTETFINCNNFGAISANGKVTNTDNIAVGGFIGCDYRYTTAINCTNFGNISSQGTASGGLLAGHFAGYTNKDEGILTLTDFGQYGAITGTACANTIYKYVNTETKLALDMRDGAAVRISEHTGLRFIADVSMDAIARIQKIFGTSATVSKGIIISPKAFINKAGALTHDALDAISTAANGFENGDKAYVSVVATDWFEGKAGNIAGSIIGLPYNLYKAEISGTAFLRVSVGEKEIFTIYAADEQTRVIYNVARDALDDVTTDNTKEEGVYKWNNELSVGEVYFEDGVKKTVVEGQTLYSCYTKDQRDILNAIITNGDNPDGTSGG